MAKLKVENWRASYKREMYNPSPVRVMEFRDILKGKRTNIFTGFENG